MTTLSLTQLKNDSLVEVLATTLDSIVSPKISSIEYIGDDTAASINGSQIITIHGSGFQNGAIVQIDGSSVGLTSFIDAQTIAFTSPAKNSGSYTLYVINPDGGTAIYIPGIQYSGTPSWSTSAGSLGSLYETQALNYALSASSDSSITYQVISGELPVGSNLNSSTGIISGTAGLVSNSTVYSFSVSAIDEENQDTARSFNITVNPDIITWTSPSNSQIYSGNVNDNINITLDASSVIGDSITYSVDSLPAGLSLTGSSITGTYSVAANSSSIITATSGTTNKTSSITLNFEVAELPAISYFASHLPINTAAYSNDSNYQAICKDSALNIYMLTSQSSGNGTPLLTKLSSSGELIWSKTIVQTSTTYQDDCNDIVCDANDNLYISVHMGHSNGKMAYLAKLNSSDGSIIWERQIASTSNAYMYNILRKLQLDNNGNLYAGGYVYDIVDTTNYKLVLAKFDTSTGNTIWSKLIYTSSKAVLFKGFVLDPTNTYIYITGNSTAFQSYWNAFLCKINTTDGSVVFLKDIPPGRESSGDMACDSSGNVYILCQPLSTYYYSQLVKFNSTGSIVWQRTIKDPVTDEICWAKYINVVNDKIYTAHMGQYTSPMRGLDILTFDLNGNVLDRKLIKSNDASINANAIGIRSITTDSNMDLYFLVNYYDTNSITRVYIFKVPSNGTGTGNYGVLSYIQDTANLSVTSTSTVSANNASFGVISSPAWTNLSPAMTISVSNYTITLNTYPITI